MLGIWYCPYLHPCEGRRLESGWHGKCEVAWMMEKTAAKELRDGGS
jgi:hypothetical protein